MENFAGARFKSWGKNLSLCTCAVLVPSLTLLVVRFNISPQDSAPLAEIQRLLGINYASAPPVEARPEIIGHRGSGGKTVTENTPSAIQGGIDAKVHWIEIDVRKARNLLILFHDETVASLTGEPASEAARVRDLELETIRTLQGTKPIDHQIISLAEALGERDFKEVQWLIDIKEPGIKEELLALLKAHQDELPKERIILQSTFDIIRDFKDEDYALSYAAGWGEGSNKTKFLFGHEFIVERCESLGPRLQYLALPNVFLNQSLIDEVKAKRQGLRVLSWRGETEENWERSTGLGVDGLIVDDVKGAMDKFHPTSE